MASFHKGDRVRHARRPEWGEGTVDVAQTVKHNGAEAQRLVIQFAQHGRVTVNTAFAEIVPSNGTAPSGAGEAWSIDIPEGSPAAKLAELPESATDPLSTLSRRLNVTLDLYRFPHDAKGMMAWASARTGIADPLTTFARHELEQHYQVFCTKREHYLRQLVGLIQQSGENELLTKAGEHPTPAAREAVKRAVQTGW